MNFLMCQDCRSQVAMKGRSQCIDCFHKTHIMCTNCCWGDARDGEECTHVYRPHCRVCGGTGWLSDDGGGGEQV